MCGREPERAATYPPKPEVMSQSASQTFLSPSQVIRVHRRGERSFINPKEQNRAETCGRLQHRTEQVRRGSAQLLALLLVLAIGRAVAAAPLAPPRTIRSRGGVLKVTLHVQVRILFCSIHGFCHLDEAGATITFFHARSLDDGFLTTCLS